MLDLKKTDVAAMCEEGYKLQLHLPEVNTPLQAWITVRGKDAKKVVEFGEKKVEEMQLKEKIAKRKNKEVEPMSLTEMKDFGLESALIRVKSWEGIGEGKVELPCTEENIRRVFIDHPWIKQAVLDASDNLANFLD